MKNIFNIFIFLFFSFLIIPPLTLASNISATYHYAWGENVGWIDFANITVSDTALAGSLYGENIGWIDLATITNDGGDLSGYAWGENIGWVDFSPVAIDANGVFTGSAYGENIGWLTFGTEDNKVVTDWRPAGGGSSSGSRPNKTKTMTTLITDKAPVCMLTITLRQGSRGEEVKCLQTRLNITADGIFGPITKATVIAFQKNHNLVPDGIVGPITRGVINSLIEN